MVADSLLQQAACQGPTDADELVRSRRLGHVQANKQTFGDPLLRRRVVALD
jgi:hypothetical protein